MAVFNLKNSNTNPKLKNNLDSFSSNFNVGRPETLTEWKSESATNGRTGGRTWVGARDACASKN